MELSRWTTLIFDKLEGWTTTFIKMLPNLVLAFIVVAAGYFLSKLVRNISTKVTQRISNSDSVSSVVSVILQTLTMFFALTIALNILGLDKAVASILAGVGIIGLALGFAFQDLSSNFISGLYMAFRRPFEIGDKVETNAFVGTIEKIELRSTTMSTTAGLHVIIPNKDIFQKPIINYSRSENRRVELAFTLPNTTDLGLAESIVRKALEQLNGSAKEIEFYYTGIEDPKIKLSVSFQIDNQQPKSFMVQRHNAILAIHRELGENNIVKIATPEHSAP
ncbi:MAG TPA: mechanosensitive ion channel domain-containing protein [Chryseolinea sp.]|nr:mechanosensitive ion channel domain-containing protein [Chryseolinea sp.]